MPFDQNFIRVFLIGVIFLIVLGFIVHSSYQKIQDTTKNIDSNCSQCYIKTKTITNQHSFKIEGLLKQFNDRQDQLNNIKSITEQEEGCYGFHEIKAENEKLISRIYDIQQWERHHNYNQLVNNFNKCETAFNIIMNKIDDVYN